jgi:hypothetical protein
MDTEAKSTGLYAVCYDGETRPAAAFVLEQDAERYASRHSNGVAWEVRHGPSYALLGDYDIYCPECKNFTPMVVDDGDRPDLVCGICKLIVVTLRKVKGSTND